MENTDYNKGEFTYVTAATYEEKRPEPRGTTPKGESMTVPGHSMTIKEIIARSMGGLPPEEVNHSYFDPGDLEKVNKFYSPHILDLTDLDELGKNASELKTAVENAIKKRNEEEGEPQPEPTPEPDPEPDTPDTPQ